MNLQQFFAELDRYPGAVPLRDLVALQRRLAITPDDVKSHLNFGDTCYRRNLLRNGQGYQAWILCWKPGQASPIHDHRGSACGVLVLQGACTETVFHQEADGMLREGKTRTLPLGDVCGSYDSDIHEIRNDGDEPLVTLHVYTPPLATMGIYSRETAAVSLWTP